MGVHCIHAFLKDFSPKQPQQVFELRSAIPFCTTIRVYMRICIYIYIYIYNENVNEIYGRRLKVGEDVMKINSA